MAEAVKAFAAGRAPPNSRYSRVQLRPRAAFRVDHDDYTDAELARDPFYQEFLRPAGYFWHANLALTIGRDELVELSLKRLHRGRPVSARGCRAARCRGARSAGRGPAREIHARRRSARHGSAARAARRPGVRARLLGPGAVAPRRRPKRTRASPLHVIRHRLVASDPAAQPALDRAIARVLAEPGATALVPLTGPQGRRALPADPARARPRARHLPLGRRARGADRRRRAAAAHLPRRRDGRARVRADRPRSGRDVPASRRARRSPMSRGTCACRSAPCAFTCAAFSPRPGPTARPSLSRCSADCGRNSLFSRGWGERAAVPGTTIAGTAATISLPRPAASHARRRGAPMGTPRLLRRRKKRLVGRSRPLLLSRTF